MYFFNLSLGVETNDRNIPYIIGIKNCELNKNLTIKFNTTKQIFLSGFYFSQLV